MFQKSSHFPKLLELTFLNLSPRKVTLFLLRTIALLVLLFFLEKGTIYLLSSRYHIRDPARFLHYFNFDAESNFPSLYSVLTLGFCSYLLAIITIIKKETKANYIRQWQTLSLIFLFLAIDENCGIHEFFIPVTRKIIDVKGIFYFAWVIPASILIVIFLIAFREFIIKLPKKTKKMFILAGAVYLSGALGMELLGGYLVDTSGFYTVKYAAVSTIEELLEMFGIVIFINALLSYIQSYLSMVQITFCFHEPDKKLS